MSREEYYSEPEEFIASLKEKLEEREKKLQEIAQVVKKYEKYEQFDGITIDIHNILTGESL